MSSVHSVLTVMKVGGFRSWGKFPAETWILPGVLGVLGGVGVLPCPCECDTLFGLRPCHEPPGDTAKQIYLLYNDQNITHCSEISETPYYTRINVHYT
jgi:hypothetical protein